MAYEHYNLCGLSVAVIRAEDGEPLIVTSTVARGLGIADGVRVHFDAAARKCGLLRRVAIDHGNGRRLVDAVSLAALDRYADLMWKRRTDFNHAAADKLWAFRGRLRRALKISKKSMYCGRPRRREAKNASKKACGASGPIPAMSPCFLAGTPFNPLLKAIVDGVLADD